VNGRPVDVDRSTRRPISYQLEIMLERPLRLRVGRLGPIELDAGRYVYTGSAKRALESRIARHLRGDKKVHWHIDYLLSAPGVRVVAVRRSRRPECELQRATPGRTVAPGFGASDCRAGCGSHLKHRQPC
jgi:Uri superfamily endonuclease